MEASYHPRIVDEIIAQHVADFPAVSVVGPRASGKTTTASRLAGTVLRLDVPAEAAVVEANPDAALRGRIEPVLIDEWQEAPAVLGAVKRAVDRDPHPGRFLLTGSVHAELDNPVWPGTGRVIPVPVTTLSVREQAGNARAEPVIERIARSGRDELHVPASPLDVRDYLELALGSGFPEPALRLPARARRAWLEAYARQLVSRDARSILATREPARLGRFFEALALNTAGVVGNKTIYETVGINRSTADAYSALLQNLFVIDLVQAWSTNRLKRLVKTPKRYLVDAGLAAAVINAGEEDLMRDAGLLGRFLDTFVAAQFRAELPACPGRPRMFHLRTEGGRQEIDLILELSGGRIIAVEVKAAARVTARDARHLVWLRDVIGDRFLHGLVLHAGPHVFELSERVTAAPIRVLWN